MSLDVTPHNRRYDYKSYLEDNEVCLGQNICKLSLANLYNATSSIPSKKYPTSPPWCYFHQCQ